MSRKKTRPQPGDPLTDEMSERDIAATGILTRRQIQTWKKLANVPEDEFERLLDSKRAPSANHILEAYHDNPVQRRARCCPHCGGKIE